MTSRCSILVGCLLFLPALPIQAQPEAPKVQGQSPGEEDIEQEMSEIQDDSFPDLVPVGEQSDFMKELELLQDSEIVESASRHRQYIGKSPAAITVLTHEDIVTSGANTLADLLRMVPGMDVVFASPAYHSISSRIHWNAANVSYLVLLDGRDLTDPFLGQAFLAQQPIFLEDISRLEVIRGAGSPLYGSNAMAGVVSITTRSFSEKDSAWIYLDAGEFGTITTAARGSVGLGNFHFSVSGGAEKADRLSLPRTNSKEIYKIRATSETRLSDSKQLTLDFAYVQGTSTLATNFTSLDVVSQNIYLQTAFRTKELFAKIYWTFANYDFKLHAPLNFNNIPLAKFVPVDMDGNHIFQADVQWTLPSFWDPLLLIAGINGRAFYLSTDQMLDSDSYSNPDSPGYHEPGIQYWGGNIGGYLQLEVAPVVWFTFSGSLRLDFDSVTDFTLSPRLAAIFQFWENHFFRIGISRAFRNPKFGETHMHPLVDFPANSPLKGGDREAFLEFMSRTLGNPNLENERLLAIEAGYMGKFVGEKLMVTVDLFYSELSNLTNLNSNIVVTSQGLPDLSKSTVQFQNTSQYDNFCVGSEVSLQYHFSDFIVVMASWTYRQQVQIETDSASDLTPKNLFSLGGRFRSESGLLGSLYLFSRSTFSDTRVQNPNGLFEPLQTQRFPNELLIFGKIGWQLQLAKDINAEAGVRLQLPISPWDAPYFRFREVGGGFTAQGEPYGGEQLCRQINLYVQGNF